MKSVQAPRIWTAYLMQSLNGAVKHTPHYQELQFAKLGYVAKSILDTIPLLTMLLNEAPKHTE